MSVKEIYDFCLACQSDDYNNNTSTPIAMTLEDIQKPTGPFVQSLYGMLLGSGWFVKLEDVEGSRGRYLGMMAYKVSEGW